MAKRHGPLMTPVRSYGSRHGFDEYFSTGRRVQVRRKTEEEAQEAANDLAVKIARGRRDLVNIDPMELAQFRAYRKQLDASRSLGDALTEFMALKENVSTTAYKSLKYALRPLERKFGREIRLAAITTPMLQRLLNTAGVGLRRKYNLLAAWKALWSYEQRQGYLPEGMTAPQKVEGVPRIPGKVNVLTPDQLRVLFNEVREEYLPWLAIGAFAGVRSEEIAPDRDSKKSPLLWSDVKWDQGHIFLRRETAKTGRRKNPQPRIIPISDTLAQWLAAYRFSTGRVCKVQPTQGETARLGKFLPGKVWPHNCLRDSFISYSIAIQKGNRAQVAYWAGNSEQMIAQSYEELQPEEIAQEYFGVRPEQPGNVIASKIKSKSQDCTRKSVVPRQIKAKKHASRHR